MEPYTAISTFITTLPLAHTWPDISNLISEGAARRDPNWLLPILAGEAVGAARPQLIPAAAALACQQLQIILVDDMLDHDPRGLHNRIGSAAAANLAAALSATAVEALCHSQAGPAVTQAAIASLAGMGLLTSYGQHLDALNPDTESAYWETVAAKSAPFFATAFHLGALLGGADSQTAAQLKTLGGLYGELIQIFDDVNDSMARPANPDWEQGRSPLPVLFAQTVPHPDRERFTALRRRLGPSTPAHADGVADPALLAAAQDLLIRSGAISYCVDQIVTRHAQALHLLHSLPLQNTAGLEKLLAEAIDPVQRILGHQQKQDP